jgi:hypothetical protein
MGGEVLGHHRILERIGAGALRELCQGLCVRAACVVALVPVTACSAPASPTPTTGLTGVVMRGPITPVCEAGIACDAPFSAGFTAEQNRNVVAHFRSDAAGRFAVGLQPGTYRIVPDADAPLIAPTSQARVVDVGPVGLTEVRLQFDTGIR